jgi:predicted nucleotidyltransferase
LTKLPTPITDLLQAIQSIFRKSGVDFFLVGALARDVQLSAKPEFAAKRKTNDVDLAILLENEQQFDQIKKVLLATGDFEEIPNNALKVRYKKTIELDLLPFGGIESEDRHLLLKGGALVTLDMSGFREAFEFVEQHTLAEGLSLNICPLEGLVLLKLIAQDENSSRSKDITDIEHLIEVYFDLNDTEIYTTYFDVMSLYDPGVVIYLQLVSARVIGRKMKHLLHANATVIEKLSLILSKRQTEAWQAMRAGLLD